MKEGDFRISFINVLNKGPGSKAIRHYKIETGTTELGFPDSYFMAPRGRMCFLEFKVFRDKMFVKYRPHQHKFIKLCEARDIDAYFLIAYSLEEFGFFTAENALTRYDSLDHARKLSEEWLDRNRYNDSAIAALCYRIMFGRSEKRLTS